MARIPDEGIVPSGEERFSLPAGQWALIHDRAPKESSHPAKEKATARTARGGAIPTARSLMLLRPSKLCSPPLPSRAPKAHRSGGMAHTGMHNLYAEGIYIPFGKLTFFSMHAAAQSASHSFHERLQWRIIAHVRALRVHRAESQFAVVIIDYSAPIPEEDADV